MALPREVYQILEDIVGPENISEEPATLDAYAFPLYSEGWLPGPFPEKYKPRPEAVVLPGSTEEVQAIVRTCNRYRIKYKAFGTGWGPDGYPTTEGVIQLDMRRMDRILEIDEKNMFAVVEPYVIGTTLQVEAMKVGLNCHMIGAGGACSILAAATSYSGAGADSIYMGYAGEVLLAQEWVMPDGEILRTGSLGSGLGWFCGEGPGPSGRGIGRGEVGAQGGMGVYTKCAVKLSPWPGPPVVPVEGTVPAYTSPIPENFRSYTVAFPSWQAFADACIKIYDSGIGYLAHRQFSKLGTDLTPAFLKMYTDPTKTIDDLEEILEDPEVQKLTEEMMISFQIVLAGMTPRDIEYQDKVLKEILAQTGGWNVAAMAEPAMQNFTYLYLVKLGAKNLNYTWGGGYRSSFAQKDTPDFIITHQIETATEVMRKHIKRGGIVDSPSGDFLMGAIGSMGGGGHFGLEQFTLFDVHDYEAVNKIREYTEEAAQVARETGLGRGIEGTLDVNPTVPEEELQSALAKTPHAAAFHWQWKVKQMLDPNDTGDKIYLTLKKPPSK